MIWARYGAFWWEVWVEPRPFWWLLGQLHWLKRKKKTNSVNDMLFWAWFNSG